MTARHGIRVGLAAAAVCTAIGLVGYRFGRAHADGAPTMQPLYYSGVLDDGGRPVEGTRNITVRLWDAVMGGTSVCTTMSPSTPVSAGRFRLALEATCATAVQANPNLWAEVAVEGTTFPRQKLGAVPYALEAGRAAGASGDLLRRITELEARASRQVEIGPMPSPVPYPFMDSSCISGTPTSLSRFVPSLSFVARSTGLYRISVDSSLLVGGGFQARLRIQSASPRVTFLVQDVGGMDSGSNHHISAVVALERGFGYEFFLEYTQYGNTGICRVTPRWFTELDMGSYPTSGMFMPRSSPMIAYQLN